MRIKSIPREVTHLACAACEPPRSQGERRAAPRSGAMAGVVWSPKHWSLRLSTHAPATRRGHAAA